MTGPPVLSVGIATLDRPAALARCLDALLSGSVLPSEVIVIDQGQSRESAEVVRQHQDGSVPLIYLRQRRRGLSAARNAMIARTRTSHLVITDDDCVPGAEWLAAISRAFATAPVPDAVTGRVLALGPERPGTYAVSLRTATVRKDFVGPALPWVVGTGANFAVRKERLLRCGGDDDRLLVSGARIRYEPDAVVYHERQPEARRMASRLAYSYGIGAACGMLFGRGDCRAVPMLWRWLSGRIARLLTALGDRDSNAARQAWLGVIGTIRGLGHGCRAERRAAVAGPIPNERWG